VTQTRIRIWPTVAQFSLGLPPLYMRAKFQVSSFSRSEDRRGSQNVKVAPPLLCGESGPTSNTMFHRPHECSSQTASWSVRPFLHSEAEISRVTDRHTLRQTPRISVRIDCISCSSCTLVCRYCFYVKKKLSYRRDSAGRHECDTDSRVPLRSYTLTPKINFLGQGFRKSS